MKPDIKNLLKKKTIVTIDYLVLQYVLHFLEGLSKGKNFEDIYFPFCLFALSYCENEKGKDIQEFFTDDSFINLLKDYMQPTIFKCN